MNRPKNLKNYYNQLLSASNADSPSYDEKQLLKYNQWLIDHYYVSKVYRADKNDKPYVLVIYTDDYKNKRYFHVYVKECKGKDTISQINISYILSDHKRLDIYKEDHVIYKDIRCRLADTFRDKFSNVPRETLAECKSIESLA